MELFDLTFLARHENVIFLGPPGVGKTHLTAAFCHQAVLQGRQTIFITLFDFTSKLAKAKSPYNLIEYYSKVPLLFLDEIG